MFDCLGVSTHLPQVGMGLGMKVGLVLRRSLSSFMFTTEGADPGPSQRLICHTGAPGIFLTWSDQV